MASTGLLGTVLGTLDPTTGDGVVDKLGPLVVVVAYVLVTTAIALGYVNPSGAAVGAYGVLSALAGGFLKHSAPTPQGAA